MNPLTSRLGWTALGAALAAVALALFAVGVRRSGAARDLTAEVPTAPVVLADARAPFTLRARALPGADLSRVTASLDGHPIALRRDALAAGELAFDLPANLAPGAHALSAGITHRGDIQRRFVLPLLVGPFAPRGDWTERAIEIALPGAVLDDHDPATANDLAGAVDALVMRSVPRNLPLLGAASSARTTVTPGAQPGTLDLRGRLAFAQAAVDYAITVRVVRASDRRLALVPLAVHATPDARVLALARQAAGFLGAVASFLTGSDIAADEAVRRAQAEVDALVARMLPGIERTLELPASVPLADGGAGAGATAAQVELRLNTAPIVFTPAGDTVLALDARVLGAPPAPSSAASSAVTAAAAALVPGPLAFAPLPPSTPPTDGRAHLRIAPRLLAALADAYGASGALDRALARTLAARLAPGDPALPAVRAHASVPPVIERAHAGEFLWSLADLAVVPASHAPGELPADVHAFARGGLRAQLRPDGGAVRVGLRVDTLEVACRDAATQSVRLRPCQADVLAAGWALTATLNRALPTLELFGDTLAWLSTARFGGALGVALRPEAIVAVGADDTAAPALDVAVAVRFGAT